MKDSQDQQLATRSHRAAPPQTRDRPSPKPPPHRWFPALLTGALILGFVMILGPESAEVLSLRRERARLENPAGDLELLRSENARLVARRTEQAVRERAWTDHRELTALREESKRLQEQRQEMAALQSEHERLKQNYSRTIEALRVLHGDDPFAEAMERAGRIHCINNIKQIGLAARIWGNDNNDQLPLDFLTMTNELVTPKILHCPGEENRTKALTWAEFNDSNASYQILSPGAPETDPSVVYVRCPIHGNIGLVDGSAHMLSLEARFVTENGLTRQVRTEP